MLPGVNGASATALKAVAQDIAANQARPRTTGETDVVIAKDESSSAPVPFPSDDKSSIEVIHALIC